MGGTPGKIQPPVKPGANGCWVQVQSSFGKWIPALAGMIAGSEDDRGLAGELHCGQYKRQCEFNIDRLVEVVYDYFKLILSLF